MTSFRDTLVSLKNSLLMDAALEAETLIETPLHEVIREAEIRGTMPSCLCDYRDPLVILMEREDRGYFSFHDYLVG